MLAEAALVISAIKAANDAFSTITTAKGNASSVLAGARKFLEAKHKVDVQAAEDNAKGQTSTQAFVASIQLKRKQIELDNFFTYECEGWVAAEWNRHKASLRSQAQDEIFAAKQAGKRVKPQQDDTVIAAIKAFVIILVVGAAILIAKGEDIKDYFIGNGAS